MVMEWLWKKSARRHQQRPKERRHRCGYHGPETPITNLEAEPWEFSPFENPPDVCRENDIQEETVGPKAEILRSTLTSTTKD